MKVGRNSPSSSHGCLATVRMMVSVCEGGQVDGRRGKTEECVERAREAWEDLLIDRVSNEIGVVAKNEEEFHTPNLRDEALNHKGDKRKTASHGFIGDDCSLEKGRQSMHGELVSGKQKTKKKRSGKHGEKRAHLKGMDVLFPPVPRTCRPKGTCSLTQSIHQPLPAGPLAHLEAGCIAV
mmetsp:Transcript_40909/g.80629  ORF Transcript_40909/g.80629 Transcript_40909/m.80629 type:complete len:180 (-) Transcript_40909:516-1055(-)